MGGKGTENFDCCVIFLTSVCFALTQVSILLAIELIWNLCEVLFIDAAPG